MVDTHEIAPGVTSYSGMILTPFSTAFEILSTERDMTTEMKRAASARWKPDAMTIALADAQFTIKSWGGSHLGKSYNTRE